MLLRFTILTQYGNILYLHKWLYSLHVSLSEFRWCQNYLLYYDNEILSYYADNLNLTITKLNTEYYSNFELNRGKFHKRTQTSHGTLQNISTEVMHHWKSGLADLQRYPFNLYLSNNGSRFSNLNVLNFDNFFFTFTEKPRQKWLTLR